MVGSDAPELDLREQIAKIDNLREEALKFMVEQRKEAAKLNRERWPAPWTLIVAFTTGVGWGVVQLVAKHFGW